MSSCVAELIALTDMSKEVLFTRNLLHFFQRPPASPIIIFCDNAGAVFLSHNREVKRTKYLDIRYHFIREFIAKNILDVKFVESELNCADIFTKNTVRNLYDVHTKFLADFVLTISA